MQLKYVTDRNIRLRWGSELEDESECLGSYGVTKNATVHVLGRILGGTTGQQNVPQTQGAAGGASRANVSPASPGALEESAGGHRDCATGALVRAEGLAAGLAGDLAHLEGSLRMDQGAAGGASRANVCFKIVINHSIQKVVTNLEMFSIAQFTSILQRFLK